MQCSNIGTYALWKNPDYDPDQPEGPGNRQYLNHEYLPGGSKNPDTQDILPTATVYMDPTNIKSPGVRGTFKVAIKIRNSYNVNAVEGTVFFDPTALRYSSIKLFTLPPSFMPTVDSSKGSVHLEENYGSTVANINGPFVELTFEVVEQKASTIRLPSFMLTGAEGNRLDVNIERNTVDITVPPTVYIDPATIESPAAGETFTVDIKIKNSDNVNSVSTTVNFDPTALRYSSHKRGSYIPEEANIGSNITTSQDQNILTLVALFLGDYQDGDGTLFTVTFEVVEQKASTISLTNVQVAKGEGGRLDVFTQDTEVTVPTSGGTSSNVQGNSVGTQQQKSVSPPPQMEIGDSNLAAVIRETLGLDADAEITDTDMADLTGLVASDRGITDIAGLEHAANLTELDLRDNEITDIGALSGLTGLTFLHLGGNSISDLSALSDLTGLTHLYLGRNSISDLSALSSLTNLTHFSLGRGDVTDIGALSGLTNLVRLYLERNTIRDLTPLTNLTALKYLYLNRNNISDVSPLAGLVNLETLRLSNNPILDTSPLYALLETTGGKLSTVNITITEYPPWDLNEDGVVDATDSALVTAALGQSGNDIVNPRTDINGDATVDADDLTLVTEHLDAGAAPSSREVFTLLDRATLETLDPDTLAAQLASLRAKSDGSLKYQRAIALLESVLAAMRPDKTKLLANYPNPFNPETWIPYHLAKASDVQITIYDARGVVIRQLDLGHQREGYYIHRSRAAHWDGRNAIGERVASGLYLYQLQADNMSLLRKMVILK